MWILPSRSRPGNLPRFASHYLSTWATDRVYVRLDDDDPFLASYLEISLPESFIVRVGPRARMPQALNEAFSNYPYEPYYGMLGDDVVPRSEAWDSELAKAAKEWGISYGRDGQGDSLRGRHSLMGGQLARAWGRLALRQMTHLYNDTVWMALGDALGVPVYVESVYMEHLHFSCGKSEFDEIYSRIDEYGNYATRDQRVFEAWREKDLPGTAERIRAMMPK